MLFKPGENERLYYTVTEVAELLDVNASLLRFWEKEFDIIKPKRNKKGTRFYTAADIEKIRMIYKLVKDQGFTLQGAREKMKAKQNHQVDNNAEVLSKLRYVREVLVKIGESI
ncbi:MAG TPA: MerR family transcriptional regulator [Bacteroidales bacterium]|nr:MAG: MerR family transcriptional regulator [Bacteroidetes bacterium GWE2_42_24]OFY27669.1 MAG: MerR family transcriptional regulator [Bacteroidetes bacterium GWF2_43_11]PKP28048.1 MAG: MerR family transcriptional regulator [Bacteroidetes bacterium HGW-Bacteroidetes-22]HAQ64371.1 MerR family transcriptional regulator [Bacteroidales bacterium]HBZ66516.1 MerR family transcriptional regulator [Bacteroidales bacterium]